MVAEPFLYKGIVVVTFGVIDGPTATNPNRITFTFDSPGDDDMINSNFIHQIKDIGGGQLEATKLTVEGVREVIKTNHANRKEVLFSIHGYADDPRRHLATNIKNTNHRVLNECIMRIPILWWPSEQGKQDGVAHFYDQRVSESAGRLLQSLTSPNQNETVSKSIVCHSIGNRILEHFANEGVTFDNIFMVDADIDYRVFNREYINGGLFGISAKREGLKIRNMLTEGKGGKIHVLYSNKKVDTLHVSSVERLRSRLGFTGVNPKNVHPEVKDSIVGVDCSLF